MTVTFYGCSDDLIYVEGCKGADEYGAWNPNEDSHINGEFVLMGDGGQVRVIAIYDGCWSFALAPVDEDVAIPSWPVRMSLHELGYSTKLEIDAPNAVVVRKAA